MNRIGRIKSSASTKIRGSVGNSPTLLSRAALFRLSLPSRSKTSEGLQMSAVCPAIVPVVIADDVKFLPAVRTRAELNPCSAQAVDENCR